MRVNSSVHPQLHLKNAEAPSANIIANEFVTSSLTSQSTTPSFFLRVYDLLLIHVSLFFSMLTFGLIRVWSPALEVKKLDSTYQGDENKNLNKVDTYQVEQRMFNKIAKAHVKVVGENTLVIYNHNFTDLGALKMEDFIHSIRKKLNGDARVKIQVNSFDEAKKINQMHCFFTFYNPESKISLNYEQMGKVIKEVDQLAANRSWGGAQRLMCALLYPDKIATCAPTIHWMNEDWVKFKKSYENSYRWPARDVSLDALFEASLECSELKALLPQENFWPRYFIR